MLIINSTVLYTLYLKNCFRRVDLTLYALTIKNLHPRNGQQISVEGKQATREGVAGKIRGKQRSV